jgi:hypothetical protein
MRRDLQGFRALIKALDDPPAACDTTRLSIWTGNEIGRVPSVRPPEARRHSCRVSKTAKKSRDWTMASPAAPSMSVPSGACSISFISGLPMCRSTVAKGPGGVARSTIQDNLKRAARLASPLEAVLTEDIL